MPAVNQNPLTIKYRTRLAAAMLIEAKGYLHAKESASDSLNGLSSDDLLLLEKAYLKIGTLYMRGRARFVHELAAIRATAVAV